MSHVSRPTGIDRTVAPGYACNGMSRWTRTNASRSPNWTPRPTRRAQPRALILKTEDELVALRRRLKIAGPTQRDKLMRAVMIKQKFVDRLQAELDAE